MRRHSLVRVELGVGHVDRGLLQHARVANAIDREAPQRVATLVPGVEVPGLAIVRDALRGDRALGVRVGAAGVVLEPELAALKRRGGDLVERLAGRESDGSELISALDVSDRIHPMRHARDALALENA